jgi:hypothetical protein
VLLCCFGTVNWGDDDLPIEPPFWGRRKESRVRTRFERAVLETDPALLLSAKRRLFQSWRVGRRFETALRLVGSGMVGTRRVAPGRQSCSSLLAR